MKTITIATHLAVDPDVVREHVMTPALLSYVVAGLMKFQPREPAAFPKRWTPGQFRIRMLAFHLIPVGWQIIGIELPRENDDWVLRDKGSGSVARVWDHLIFIEPGRDGTRYVDQIRIDAGLLSWPVALYASLFYRYRQRRWRKLVKLNFEPLASSQTNMK